MRALIDGNPAYQAVTVMRVDWDTHARSTLVETLKVPRRSTLVMFKEGKEVGRVIAETSAEAIEPLFKAAI